MFDYFLRKKVDWVSKPHTFFLFWGIPLLVLILAAFLVGEVLKTWTWIIALVWMGTACSINASRCARSHCYYTGPFFIIMALVVLLHGYRVIWLGTNGWLFLGLAIGFGFFILWFLPEQKYGKYKIHHD